MPRMSTIKTVLRTFVVALGIGFFVQYGEAPVANTGEPLTVPRPVTVVTNRKAHSVFGVAENPHRFTEHISDVQTVALVNQEYTEERLPELSMISATRVIDDACKVSLSAQAAPAAMARLTVNAPCHKRTEFTLIHSGLRFSNRTNADGRAIVSLPVLSVDAKISLLINNVEQAHVALYAPEVPQYDRTILQWRGFANLQLHVLEDGASFGEVGHIWTGSVHTPNFAILGQHGFVSRYGTRYADIPYQAEVYTYPARLVRPDMAVMMPVGVMVTDELCGVALNVQIIQVISGQVNAPIDVSIKAPSCDNVGQFIVLPDVLRPVTGGLR
ncbi:hypothetical protein [Yoonia maritima]|uniref:hypothetical protein n=1 Tax=Yoonia maritima TaxID=1435347 RepID=UPI000D0FB240|nr:hypothetical protein [Yoonia maritima]